MCAALDRERVVRAHCQRLFHHDRNAVPGGGFHNASMIARVGVHQHGLRMHRGQHFFDIRVKQLRIELELVGAPLRNLLVRLGDADDLDVGALQCGGEEAANMSVDEADDGHA